MISGPRKRLEVVARIVASTFRMRNRSSIDLDPKWTSTHRGYDRKTAHFMLSFFRIWLGGLRGSLAMQSVNI